VVLCKCCSSSCETSLRSSRGAAVGGLHRYSSEVGVTFFCVAVLDKRVDILSRCPWRTDSGLELRVQRVGGSLCSGAYHLRSGAAVRNGVAARVGAIDTSSCSCRRCNSWPLKRCKVVDFLRASLYVGRVVTQYFQARCGRYVRQRVPDSEHLSCAWVC
jgi:hypothetical protein